MERGKRKRIRKTCMYMCSALSRNLRDLGIPRKRDILQNGALSIECVITVRSRRFYVGGPLRQHRACGGIPCAAKEVFTTSGRRDQVQVYMFRAF